MRHGGVCRRRYDSLEWPRLQACQAGFGQGERAPLWPKFCAARRAFACSGGKPTNDNLSVVAHSLRFNPSRFCGADGIGALERVPFERRRSQSAAGQRFAVRGGQSLPVSAIGITSAAKHSVPLGRSGTPHGILATHCRMPSGQ